MKKVYDIKNVKCGGCVANVKEVLENMPSVSSAEVSIEDQNISIEVGEDFDENELREQLEKEGYPLG